MCEAGGLGGKCSNHSLRSTAATHLYQSGVEEQQIANLTGHCSVAVRNYKRTSVEQKKQLSDLLYNNKKPKMCTAVCSEEVKPEEPEMPVNTRLSMPNVNAAPVEINIPKITINPVINLRASDLIVQNNNLQIPPIDVQLTINIS